MAQSKKKFELKKVNSPLSLFTVTIATGLGLGLSPIAPGTLGTLLAVPIVMWTFSISLSLQVLFWITLFSLGTWSAYRFDRLMNTNDNSHIVIDEVVGFGIAAWSAQVSWVTMLAAFIFFRIFDIFKFTPVRQLDYWSKKQTHPLKRGLGVMLDDVLAGVQALVVVLLLQYIQWIP